MRKLNILSVQSVQQNVSGGFLLRHTGGLKVLENDSAKQSMRK